MIKYILLLIFLVPAPSAGKVVFLVLEGLTQALKERIATPALDSVVRKGAEFVLKPEFPAESLPTLQAMMTGQHSEMTGVLGQEVYSDNGKRLQATDMEFWLYNQNISTIAELNGFSADGRTGSIGFPGVQFYSNQEKIFHWGTAYHIVDDVNQTKPAEKKHSRRRRSLDDGLSTWDEEEEGDNQEVAESQASPAQPDSKPTESIIDRFVINKTTDKEWLDWSGQVETVADWLSSSNPVNLVLFYLTKPGDIIRAFGPESTEADLAVYKVDQLVGHLVEVLEKRQLLQDTNLVITGLHGFTEISSDNVFDITNLVDPKYYTVYGRSPVLNLEPVPDKMLEVFAAMMRGEDKDKFDKYDKHHIPPEFHYKDCDRVPSIVLVAKEGFAFANTFFSEVKELNKRANRSNLLSNKYGFAGYDNSLLSMESLLLMQGPGVFKPAVHPITQVRVQAVDVFPLLAHFLGITPPKTNGSLEHLRDYLSNPPSHTVQVIKQAIDYIQQRENLPMAGVLLGVTILLLLLVCCCCCLRYRSKDITKNHSYKYSTVKNNRRHDSRVDGSDPSGDDKIGLLTSAIMQEDLDIEEPA